MGRPYAALLLLSVCLAAGLSGAENDAGTSAEVTNFAFPDYKGDRHLQCILYGVRAKNLGAMIHVFEPVVDVMKNDILDINTVTSAAGLKPYPVTSDDKVVEEFWKDRDHSQAMFFADAAVYDRTTRMLRSDSPVHLRMRELAADGVGFDADQANKRVHIRSNVVIIIQPGSRRRSGISFFQEKIKDRITTKEHKK